MKDNTFKLFLILKGLKPNSRIPLHAFIEKDYNMAKIYFQGYLDGTNYEEFQLRQIGYFNKQKLIENDIFITGGFEAKYAQKEDNTIKKQKKIWDKFYESDADQAVKVLFEGEFLNEQ